MCSTIKFVCIEDKYKKIEIEQALPNDSEEQDSVNKQKEVFQFNKLKREEVKGNDRHNDTPEKQIKLPLKSSFSKDKVRKASKEKSLKPSDSENKVPEIKIGNLDDKTPATNTLKASKKK